MKSRLAIVAAGAGLTIACIGSAWAGLGQPTFWQMGPQDSATPVMEDVASFHFFLLWIIAAISAFVLALLLIVIVRFNARTNPSPSRTTHNTPIDRLNRLYAVDMSRMHEASPHVSSSPLYLLLSL